jgi:hypothetical protein
MPSKGMKRRDLDEYFGYMWMENSGMSLSAKQVERFFQLKKKLYYSPKETHLYNSKIEEKKGYSPNSVMMMLKVQNRNIDEFTL